MMTGAIYKKYNQKFKKFSVNYGFSDVDSTMKRYGFSLSSRV